MTHTTRHQQSRCVRDQGDDLVDQGSQKETLLLDSSSSQRASEENGIECSFSFAVPEQSLPVEPLIPEGHQCFASFLQFQGQVCVRWQREVKTAL